MLSTFNRYAVGAHNMLPGYTSFNGYVWTRADCIRYSQYANEVFMSAVSGFVPREVSLMAQHITFKRISGIPE